MEAGLPTGTLTFLFTDVEASTRTLESMGAGAYAEALREHHRLIRESVAAHGGVEVGTQGDSFFCVFTSASAAVACAAAAQERLAVTPVRVRMGLHSGEALVVDGDYVGIDVHRAARIAAAAHGGQVLLSPTTIPLLDPRAFPLRDVGEHRLKDLSAPIRLHQLGAQAFPPLRTLHRTNLPVPATPFLGRAREVGRIVREATDGEARLLTLTGPGGTGKTRLSLQAAGALAEEFPGGVFWVPLARLRDDSLVASAIADALGVEEEGGDVTAALVDAIEARTLLIVDNCEHVLDEAAGVVATLVGGAPLLSVIATSREPLAVSAERVIAIDPLAPADAVELFVSRAAAVGVDGVDPDVARALCARLDDLPLAIELAAARAATLPPPLLLERLSRRLDLLRGPRDADERQRTLAATIAWSYDLLTADEQHLFRRMSVFVGGAAAEAVEEIAAADVEELLSLTAKSLVRITSTGRYWMLETIREFAAAQLEATDEAAALHDRFVRWYGGVAAEAGAHLSGPDAVFWFERLEAELGNLRMAFALAVDRGSDDVVALGIALGHLHAVRGRVAEGNEVLTKTKALTRDPFAISTVNRVLGRVARVSGEIVVATPLYEEAQRLLEGVDRRDENWWREWLELKLAQAQHFYSIGDDQQLERAASELAPYVDAHALPRQRSDYLHVRLQAKFRSERYVLSEETEAIARDLLDASKAAGDWAAHFHLGFALLWRGKLDEAADHLGRALEDARRVGDVLSETRCLVYAAIIRRKQGDVEAVRELDAQLASLEELHSYQGLIAANRCWLAWREGDLDAVHDWGAAAYADWERAGRAGPTIFQWTARFPLLAADVERGRLDAAAAHASVMLEERQQPLPTDISGALARALGSRTAEAFREAVEVARRRGYT